MRSFRVLSAFLFSVCLALVVTCDLPVPPEEYEGTVTLSIPENSLVQDTVGRIVSFSIAHSYPDHLDSLHVVIAEVGTGEQVTLRFSQFAKDSTIIERTFPGPGMRTVEVTAFYDNGTNIGGRFSLEIMPRPSDAQGPDLVVLTPSPNTLLASQTLTVSGTARDESGISALTVNGTRIPMDPATDAWSASITIQIGHDTIVAVATDNSPAKNQTTQRIAVVCDTTPFVTVAAAPTEVAAAALSSDTVRITWKISTGATAYLVFRSHTDTGTFVEIGTSEDTVLVDTGLSASTTYYYQIAAANSAGSSLKSATASATTKAPPVIAPATPTGLAATAQSSSSIHLSWGAANGASSYTVYRSDSTTGTFDSIDAVAGVSYLNTGLIPNTTYFYRVSSSNSKSNSAQTASVSAKTLAAPPATPAGVDATGISASSIRVVWNKTASADSFKVHRSTAAAGTYIQVGATVDTFFTNIGLAANSVYYYKVLASNAGGASALSAADSGTTWPAVPGVPEGLTAAAGDSTKISLSWTASTGTVSGYVIGRSSHTDTTSFSSIDTVTTSSYTASGLNPGTKYLFQVKAYNMTGSSANTTASATTSPRTYTLTLTATTGGAVTVPATVTVNHGAPTTIEAAPKAGYAFTKWTVTLGTATIADSTASTTTATLTSGSATVRAGFSQNTYTVTFDSRGGSAVTSKTVAYESTMTAPTAPVRKGYNFVGWYKDSIYSAAWSFTTDVVTGPTTLHAKWTIKQYQLTTSISQNSGTVSGSVARNPDATSYDSNTTVTLTAPTDSRYNFAGWSGSMTSTSNPINVVMNAAKNMIANYTIKQYALTITISPTGAGTVVASPATGPYNHGATVFLTATENSGYSFSLWSGDASGSASQTSVTMDGPKSVTANFSVNPPAIISDPSRRTILTGGSAAFSVSASGAGTLSYQWQEGTTDLSGKAGTSLTISNATYPLNGKTYRCKVTNSGGSTYSSSATLTVNPAGMKKVPAIAGYTMGDNAIAKAFPAHLVTLTNAYWMDSTEVTKGQYDSIMAAGYSSYTKRFTTETQTQPVGNVHWYDAVLYCNANSKAFGLDTVYSYFAIQGTLGEYCELSNLVMNLGKNGYRLPTEAEWEHACRAGTTGYYFWNGDALDFAVYSESGVGIQPVASRYPNGFGLYDMIGNVAEWCNDWYDVYTNDAQTNPSGPTSSPWSTRVLRGGNIYSTYGEEISSAWRDSRPPIGYARSYYGFRGALPAN